MELPARTLETCRCGFGKDHFFVDANPSYGFWGWLALFSGMTGEPKKIVWKCRRCNEIVAQTTKKKDLRAFR